MHLNFILLCVMAGFALLIAWGVNALVGLMSGENPRDTGRQFSDIFFRILGMMRLGWMGRVLNNFDHPWIRWIVYCAGGLLILSAIIRAIA